LVEFSLSTAFWFSLIGHSFLSIIGLFTGFVFANYMEIGLLISLAVAFAFQTVFFQIAVRAKNGTFVRWRTAVLSRFLVTRRSLSFGSVSAHDRIMKDTSDTLPFRSSSNRF